MIGTHQFLDEFAFLYHLAVAEKLHFNPQKVLGKTKENLTRWKQSGNLTQGELQSLKDWENILTESGESIVLKITEISENA